MGKVAERGIHDEKNYSVQPVFAHHSGEKRSHPECSGKISLCCSHEKAQADLTSRECQRGNVPSVPSTRAAPACRASPGCSHQRQGEGLTPPGCRGSVGLSGRSGLTLFQAMQKISGWQLFPERWSPLEPGAGVLQPRSGSQLGATLPAPGGGRKALSSHLLP